LNIGFGINNERQDCKIDTVCIRKDTYDSGRVNEGDEVRKYGLHIHIYIGNRTMKPLAIALSGVGRGLEGEMVGQSNQCTMYGYSQLSQ
jgi:hypothetical protein